MSDPASLEVLFSELRSLEAAQRDARLMEIRRQDPTTAEKLAHLLDTDQELGTDHYTSTRDPISNFLMSFQRGMFDDLNSTPERIGPHRILQRIGNGGMGVVFKAEQHEPRRLVALKIMPATLFSSRARARFDLEIQLLAELNHPHIARIYESGQDPRGYAYFTLEWVDGPCIDQYVGEHPGTTRQLVQLFQQVCQGALHAHQHGVIHRDLKPANILVTRTDQGPMVKIIDFGVGKQTNNRDALTQDGAMVGTLSYMSPEQVENGRQVDSRSDIFSLGIILFELLTGQKMYKSMGVEGSADLIRHIVHEPAPKPSVALAKSDRKRAAELVSDLDWVVLKALEKDPADRYQSVSELQADLDNYLQGRPLNARPKHPFYMMRKVGKKYRTSILAAVVVVLSMVASVVIRMNSLAEKNRALAQALEAKREIEAQAKEIEDHNGVLREMFYLVHPDNTRNQLERMEERLAALDDGNITLQHTLRLYLAYGYKVWGDVASAEIHLNKILDMGLEDKNYTEAMAILAELLLQENQLESAESYITQAWRLCETGPGQGGALRFKVRFSMGRIFLEQKRYDQAKEIFEHLLHTHDRGMEPERWALASHGLALTYKNRRQFQSALPLFRQALSVQQRVLPQNNSQLLSTRHNLAVCLLETNQDQGALELLSENLCIYENNYKPDHRYNLSTKLMVARLLSGLKRHDEAVAMAENVFQLRLAKLGEHSDGTLTAALALGNIYYRMGAPNQAIDLWNHIINNAPSDLDHNALILSMTKNMAEVLLQSGNWSAGTIAMETVLRRTDEAYGPRHFRGLQIRELMGDLAGASGRCQESLRFYLECYLLDPQSQDESNPNDSKQKLLISLQDYFTEKNDSLIPLDANLRNAHSRVEEWLQPQLIEDLRLFEP